MRSRCGYSLVMPTTAKPTEPSENKPNPTEDMSTPAGEVRDLRELAEEEGGTVTPDVSPAP